MLRASLKTATALRLIYLLRFFKKPAALSIIYLLRFFKEPTVYNNFSAVVLNRSI